MRKHYRNPRGNRFILKANQTDPLKWTVSHYMNFRAHSWRAASVRQLGICLVLALWPLSNLAAPSIQSDTRTSWESRPYLTVVVPPTIRFAEHVAPRVVVPLQTGDGVQSSVTAPRSAGTAAGSPGSPSETVRPNSAPTPPAPAANPSPATTPVNEKPEMPATPAPAILPDDTQPKVRAEDFLPFFQFPGTGAGQGDVTPAPAAPGKLPPSSATYRQQ
jgi:hypothetical protein